MQFRQENGDIQTFLPVQKCCQCQLGIFEANCRDNARAGFLDNLAVGRGGGRLVGGSPGARHMAGWRTWRVSRSQGSMRLWIVIRDQVRQRGGAKWRTCVWVARGVSGLHINFAHKVAGNERLYIAFIVIAKSVIGSVSCPRLRGRGDQQISGGSGERYKR